jgi:transcriptional regulator
MERLGGTVSKLPVLKGTLDLLVLRALNWTPMHGFEIVSWLERAGNGSLDVEDSALYQAVYRLEEKGFLKADWGVTENNRRARYYSITPTGRAHLRAETKSWMRYADTVTAILTAGKEPVASASEA